MINLIALISIKFMLLQRLLALGENKTCVNNCTCDWESNSVDCSSLKLNAIPDFGSSSATIQFLDISHNVIETLQSESFRKFTNLTSLHLEFNKISEVEEGAFRHLTKLTDLRINKNILTVIKPGIFVNLKIENLYLGDNKIEHIESNAFTNLSNLELIDLNNNFLSSIRENSFSILPSLKDFYIENNRLSAVPTSFFSRTPRLDFLVMNSNSISAIDKYAFKNCLKLKKLHLTGNTIKAIHPRGFSIPAGNLTVQTLNLVYLHMANNTLEDVPAAIRSIPSLSYLDLSMNLFKSVRSSAFGSLYRLKSLHLSRIENLESIESKGFAGLVALTQLFMTSNRKLRDIPIDAFPDSYKLQTIFIEGNALRTLHERMLNWDNLKILQIGQNNFSCSCDLIWIKTSKLLQKSGTRQTLEKATCSLNRQTKYILKLNAVEMKCPIKQTSHNDAKSRLITGLIAASIASCALIVCLVLISCRRNVYSKYIQFKYHRHRDEALFTVEDPKSKTKMFSNKSLIRNERSREETLM